MKRIIGHLDMDSFFASLEERATPSFKGKPIVVGSDPKEGKGRGVVSTANYKAREYGIRSALPISKAWQLSEKAKKEGKEEVIFLPSNFDLYERSSEKILSIVKKYSSKVEQGSIDEFYFDLSDNNLKKAENICKKIKQEIKTEEKITCSIGLGPNKLIAKIAAGKNKPDGFLIIKEEEIEDFLNPLPIRTIPGIGNKTAQILYDLKIGTIKQLKKYSCEELKKILHSKTGEDIYLKARGIDKTPIIEYREVKSISGQITFEDDVSDIVIITERYLKHNEEIFNRFKNSNFKKFKTLTITIRFSDFKTISSGKTFKDALGENDIKLLKKETLRLLLPFLDRRKNPKMKRIRLIGIRLENFEK
ncbi:DNA polymerase IV [bacterium]|nr:DNA polymerase IV [bacterium]